MAVCNSISAEAVASGIHQVANNCRTSMQMIEQFYAAHIKYRLNAAAINVHRPKSSANAAKGKSDRPARRATRRESQQIRPRP